MNSWIDRFFELNRSFEKELKEHPFHHVLSVLQKLGWKQLDAFWGPDLEVSQFQRNDEELFLIQELYFNAKLTGSEEQISEVEAALDSYNPPDLTLAG